MPPVLGWAAIRGDVGPEALILCLIIFLWTPPHFWALSLNRAEEYARAGIPMLPVVAGRTATKRHIFFYTVLLVPISLLPWAVGFAGIIYGATVVICGAALLALALVLIKSRKSEQRAAHRLFAFSISYLFLLFAALLVDHSSNQHLQSHPRIIRLGAHFGPNELLAKRMKFVNLLFSAKKGEL
jgi:protoheme IX farnesyltransferase